MFCVGHHHILCSRSSGTVTCKTKLRSLILEIVEFYAQELLFSKSTLDVTRHLHLKSNFNAMILNQMLILQFQSDMLGFSSALIIRLASEVYLTSHNCFHKSLRK